MEYLLYLIPVIVLAFCSSILLSVWWYIRLRIRWHEKGILDFNWDGQDPKQNPEGKTIWYFMKKERNLKKENNG